MRARSSSASPLVSALLLLLAALAAPAGAFQPPQPKGGVPPPPSSSSSFSSPVASLPQEEEGTDRRGAIDRLLLLPALASLTSSPPAARALVVEGTSPPPQSKQQPRALSEEYRQGTAALGDDGMAPLAREAYTKLPSGLIYADVRVGSGEVAKEGGRANLQWVLRRGNGYFVDSSEVSGGVPFIFRIGEDGAAIAGVDEGIRGMRVGGVRRLIVPLNLAFVTGLDDGRPGPLPAGFGPRQQMRRAQLRADVPGEYIFLEVQLTRLRTD